MKKIIFGFGVLSVLAMEIIEVSVPNNYDKNYSELILANVEALSTGTDAEAEKGTICWQKVSCDPKYGDLSNIWYCGDCTEVPYTLRENQLTCKIQKSK